MQDSIIHAGKYLSVFCLGLLDTCHQKKFVPIRNVRGVAQGSQQRSEFFGANSHPITSKLLPA
jgi:hypothetical protein